MSLLRREDLPQPTDMNGGSVLTSITNSDYFENEVLIALLLICNKFISKISDFRQVVMIDHFVLLD